MKVMNISEDGVVPALGPGLALISHPNCADVFVIARRLYSRPSPKSVFANASDRSRQKPVMFPKLERHIARS